ncbi:MAG: GWxTD domain-containing protein [Candidatus Eiseniibacteriota bacterium]|nr:MAG: GWxTD domain-containing protein [Candidatus Eisenbacteria bacterium]
MRRDFVSAADTDGFTRPGAFLLSALLCLLLGACAATTPGERYLGNYRTALRLHEEQRHGEVLKELRPLVIRFPTWVEGSFLYARAARATGTIEGRRVACEALERLLAYYPEREDIRRELGSLYYEQGFYSYARTEYETLLEQNDEDSEAHYMRALTIDRDWRRYHDERDLSLIIAELLRVIELDPENKDAMSRLTLAHLERGQPDSVFLVLDRFLEAYPQEADAVMFNAIALHEQARYEESLQEWNKFFSLCDSVTYRAFHDIDFLLTQAQQKKLKRLQPADAEQFVRVLWKELDPTPTTDLNERVLEHWRRVGISKALFSDARSGTPGWATGPGEVLIRFGMPDRREYTFSLSGPENLALPTLVWHYEDEAGSFRVAFVDYCLSGDFQYFAFSQLPTAYDVRIYYNPAAYEHDHGAEVFENLFASAAFLRPLGIREEMYLGVPLDMVTKGDWRDVPCEVVVFDTLWNEKARVSTTLEGSHTYAEQGLQGLLIRELGFDLASGPYVVAVAVEDSVSGTIGITKRKLRVPDFSRDALCVSDIELAHVIPERRVAGGLDKDKRILPNPSGTYVAPEPVRLYFEVYNLAQDSDGRYRFVTRYSILPFKTRGDSFWGFLSSVFASSQHYIASSFEREIETASSSEQLAIDISALTNGRYRLILEIEDAVTKQRVVAERLFDKTARPETEESVSTTGG